MMRRSGGARGVVALVVAVALVAAAFAACGEEAEPSSAAPPALERRDAPPAGESERQEEAEPAGDLAAALTAAQRQQLQTVTMYVVPDDEGGIDLSLTRGVGSGPGLLRVSADEYLCEISVRQSVSDEAAGRFAVMFNEFVGTGPSGEQAEEVGSWSGVVEVAGPSWVEEYELPVVDAERIRSISVRVRSDASDAKWSVACRKTS